MNDGEIRDGCSVWATPPGFGARPKLGTVKIRLPKGAIVTFPDGSEDRFPDKKLKPANAGRTPTRALEPLPESYRRTASPLAPVFLASELEGKPIVRLVKPPKPIKCENYLDWIRGLECCGCEAPPRSDPHHYGERGVGQKTDDLRCVPLCRACHDIFHLTNCLPMLDKAETVVFLLRTQVDLLVRWTVISNRARARQRPASQPLE